MAQNVLDLMFLTSVLLYTDTYETQKPSKSVLHPAPDFVLTSGQTCVLWVSSSMRRSRPADPVGVCHVRGKFCSGLPVPKSKFLGGPSRPAWVTRSCGGGKVTYEGTPGRIIHSFRVPRLHRGSRVDVFPSTCGSPATG